MAKTFHDLSTGGAGASNPSKGGKPTVDCRAPQDNGYPAQSDVNKAIGEMGPVTMRMGTMDATPGGDTHDSSFHLIPNRSGPVKFKQVTHQRSAASPNPENI